MLRIVALWTILFVGIMATVNEAVLGTFPAKRKSRIETIKEYVSKTPRRRRTEIERGNPPKWAPKGGSPTLHTIDVVDLKGETIRLDKRNFPDAKLFLIVSIATASEHVSQMYGFTKLHRKFYDRGLQIVAFPSNSFNLEPLESEKILPHLYKKYGVTFPVMAKCAVNGESGQNIFSWLKVASAERGETKSWGSHDTSGLSELDLQSDYEKFLVYQVKDREHVLRFSYDVTPDDLIGHIQSVFQLVEGRKLEL